MAYYHSKYSNRRNKSKTHRFIIRTLSFLIISALIFAYLLYSIIFSPNTWVKEKEGIAVYIPGGSNFEAVKSILYEKGIVIHRKNFEWVAKKKNYPANIKAGKYRIVSNMSNNELVNLLRSGQQEPVRLVFNNIHSLSELAGHFAGQIEPDSAAIAKFLNDSIFIANLGFDKYSIGGLFIPNTYEIFWNIQPDAFFKRMKREYEYFWNEKRREKAKLINMSIADIITLASIVEKETQKDDEKPTLAGVYVNRLKKNWPLQADPTLVYAAGDYSIKRILDVHKEINSPYNTYKYKGLPPGPICIPSISSIDAVLNHEKHNYLYFCAKDDFSGYHAFANTLRQHNNNAEKYRAALNKLKIWK